MTDEFNETLMTALRKAKLVRRALVGLQAESNGPAAMELAGIIEVADEVLDYLCDGIGETEQESRKPGKHKAPVFAVNPKSDEQIH